MDGVEGFRLLLNIPLSGEADNDAAEDEKEEEEKCGTAAAAAAAAVAAAAGTNQPAQDCVQCRLEDERRERQKRWMPPPSNLSPYLLQSSNSITSHQLNLCPPPPAAQSCSRLCPRHCPPPHPSFQRSLPHPRRPQPSERIQPTFELKRRA